jgi:AGZA family xanthine/uracil permease-like MFS transporter
VATTTTPTPNPTQARPAEGGLDRWFEVSARGSTYRTEILGGATTFLTLVYIVFVNPAILSGTADLSGVKLGFEQVLAVTALAGGLLTIAMGVFGKYPFALASGLGLNAFAAAEVAAHRVTWASMMGIFVIDGAVIVILVVLGLRERIIDAIPFGYMEDARLRARAARGLDALPARGARGAALRDPRRHRPGHSHQRDRRIPHLD